MSDQDPQTAIDYNLYPASARPSGLHVSQGESLTQCVTRQNYEIAQLKSQLAAFHTAMQRERKPDWEKWHMDLADIVDSISSTDEVASIKTPVSQLDVPGTLKTAARELRYMATSFTLKANFVPTDLEIKALKEQVESLEKRVAELDAINKHACEDWAEDDTAIRDLCRPFLTEKTCDHDGYAVVPIQDAVKNALESLEKQNQAMRDVLRMCCTTRMEASETEIWNLARQALSTTAGRNYKSPEEVAAIVAENQKLRECLEPGKANAINAGLFECADRLGLPHSSVKHALTLLEEEILQLRSQLTAHTQALKVAKVFIEGGCSHREHVLAAINNLLK